jgi:cell division septum initiation protein DivIVA
MSHLAVRHTTVGIASMTGLVLLGLATFGDPPALLNQLRSFQAASTPRSENTMVTEERDVLRQELEALQKELEALRQQVANLMIQTGQPGPKKDDPKSLAAADVAVANPAASKAPINPPPMTMRLTGSLRERLDRVETCLVETKPQEAALLLESILFQLIFRPAPGPTAQATAGVIKQALAAVAEADLEKAAFYVSQAQPRL